MVAKLKKRADVRSERDGGSYLIGVPVEYTDPQAAWVEWNASKTPANADKVARAMLPILAKIMSRVIRRYPNYEFDIKSAALAVIPDCLRCYKNDRNTKFSTYAVNAAYKRIKRAVAFMEARQLPLFSQSHSRIDKDAFSTVAENITDIRSLPSVEVDIDRLAKIAQWSDREKKVVIERLFKNKTLQEVGDEIGLTRERVRQIEASAIVRARAHGDEIFDLCCSVSEKRF